MRKHGSTSPCSPHADGARRQQQQPEHRQAGEHAAERDFLDRLTHVGGVERTGLDEGERPNGRGSLQEEGEQRRGKPAEVPSAPGHVVGGEVVVCPKIKEAVETDVVVPALQGEDCSNRNDCEDKCKSDK